MVSVNPKDRISPGKARLIGPVVLFLFLATILVMDIFRPEDKFAPIVFYPPLSPFLLNVAFLSVLPLIISCISAVGFLSSGAWGMLFLGCGVLSLGASGFLAGWFSDIRYANVSTTIFNVGALLSGAFHALSGTLAVRGQNIRLRAQKQRRLVLGALYIGALLFMALLAGAALSGLTPSFFVQGAGPTPIRQLILSIATALFALSAFLSFTVYSRRRESFFYWYSLGLGMLATGLFGIFFEMVLFGPINWISRASQYLSGVYFLLAVAKAIREHRGDKSEDVVERIFGASGAYYQDLVETAWDAILVVKNGEVIFWNKTAGRLLGLEGARRVELTDILSTEDAAQITEDLTGRSDREETIIPAKPPHEVTVRKGNGERFPAEVSYSARRTRHRTMIILFLRDITERKRAEEERERLLGTIREEKDRLSALINNIQDEVWFADAEKRLTLVNSAVFKEFGTNGLQGELIEKVAGSFEVYRPDGTLRPLEEAPPLRALRGEIVEAQEEIVRTPANGELRYRQVSAAPVRDPGGNIMGSVSVVRDITERKNAETELRENRNKYQALIETTSDFIWEMDSLGRYTYCSPQMEKLWGIKPEEMIGKTPFDVMPAEHKSSAAESFAELAKSPKPFSGLESAAYDGQGRLIHIETSGVPFFDDGGKLLGFRGISRDITERKRMEDALRSTRDYLESLINYANAPVIVWDPALCITRFNRAFEHMTGYAAGEIVGKGLDILFPEDSRKESLKKIQSSLTKHWESVEIAILCKSGEFRIALWNSANIYDKSGKEIIATIAQGHDITDRKRAEEALRESEQRLRVIMDNTTDSIFLKDRESRMLMGNPAVFAVIGKSGEEILGKNDAEFYPDPAIGYAIMENDRRIMESGQTEVIEELAQTPQGYRIYLSTKTPLRDEQGKVIGLIGVARDITERKKAEEALRLRTQDLQELTQTLEQRVSERTNELRAANEKLKLSEGRLQHLSARLLEGQEEERKRIATDVHDSFSASVSASKYLVEMALKEVGENRRLMDAIRQLQMTIEDSRRIQMALRPSILDDLGILAALGWLAREFQKTYSQIKVSTEIEMEEQEIPQTLKLVIFRIAQEALNNIAKHSQANQVKLSLTRKDSLIELKIQDNGIGISAEVIEHKKAEKRGLGLSSMEERASLSGGVFSVHSSDRNGTLINASWPLNQQLFCEGLSITV